MLRDITIGQYYPVKSAVHSLDARVKILAVLAYIITLFFVDSFIGYAVVTVILGTTIAVSKVPFKFMVKGIKGIFVILIFTAIINVFSTQGENVLFKLGVFTATMEGVILAIKMIIRLILLIVGSSMLTLTTSPIELTDGIEYILKPFKKIGLPSHEIAMMMTIALRFIPTLLDETDKIMKAQQARGADFETGNIIQRAKSLIPILVPLFVSAFRRAEELAMAMEARCYHGDSNRTRMNEMKLKSIDYLAFVLVILYIILIIVLRIVF